METVRRYDTTRPISCADRAWMFGAFPWTGFDYKGEPTPYRWPCINSHFGILDMCGFPKDNYYYYQSWWKPQPIVHLMPHWNWAGKEGEEIRVIAFSNCARVELLLNGQSLGAKAMPRNEHLQWQVKYAPGTLMAKGFDAAGQVTATDTVETTGAPAVLRLSTELPTLTADGEDVAPVKVEVIDEKGRVVPTADNLVTFEVTGAGKTAGVGNGNPGDHDPDQADYRHAFNGLCMLVVRAGEQPGAIRVTAAAAGLKAAQLNLKVEGRLGRE
jgi:beta-galactosidase